MRKNVVRAALAGAITIGCSLGAMGAADAATYGWSPQAGMKWSVVHKIVEPGVTWHLGPAPRQHSVRAVVKRF